MAYKMINPWFEYVRPAGQECPCVLWRFNHSLQ